MQTVWINSVNGEITTSDPNITEGPVSNPEFNPHAAVSDENPEIVMKPIKKAEINLEEGFDGQLVTNLQTTLVKQLTQAAGRQPTVLKVTFGAAINWA